MAIGPVSKTSFSATGTVPKQVTLTELQTALDKLNVYKSNVNNCNCAPSNCCQSCQTQCRIV